MLKFDSVSPDVNDRLVGEIHRLRVEMGYNDLPKSKRKQIDSYIHKVWQKWKQEVLDKAVEKDAKLSL